MHKTIVYVLNTLQNYPSQNPFTSTVMKVQYDDIDSATNDLEIALFYQIVDKIKKAKKDEDYGYDLNGYFIKINPLDLIGPLFVDTQNFYRYILAGYFSRNDTELFQRLVMYFQMIVECWEVYLDIAGDAITHDASKGDGHLMGEIDLIDFVKWEITNIYCAFKIFPTLISGKYFEEKELYVNFSKIIEDKIYKNPTFIGFRKRRFSKEARKRIIDEVMTQSK